MKSFIFNFILPIIIIFSLFTFTSLGKGSAKELKSESNGVLILSSEMPDLKITLDEEVLGSTQKNISRTFALTEDGTAKNGNHEITLQKDINATHEWFFRDTFSFSKYVDVQKYPKRHINIFSSTPKQVEYPPINFKIHKRIKPSVLAKKTGLIKELKLQHNGSWHMSIDEKYIYIMTTASNHIWSLKNREKNSGEFLEIYNINSYELLQHIKLGEDSRSFTHFKGLATDENFIYIGTQRGETIYYDNIYHSKRVQQRGILNGVSIGFENGDSLLKGYDRHSGKVSNVKIYANKLFTISEDGKVGVYEMFSDDKYHFTAMINTKKHYPQSYAKLDDKRYGDLFDLVVHKNIAYISSDIGVIFKFDLNYKNPKFIGWVDTIAYEEEWSKYIGSDITAMQIYKDRYLMFSAEYRGLSMYDTLKNKMIYSQKNLYPKRSRYSQLFKKEVDVTKDTNIYKFLLYKDKLIFTEVAPEVVVYDLSKKKITHKFLGLSEDVSDIEIFKNRLFALSSGRLYVFDLTFTNSVE